ncbi:MAG: TIGR03087 family PEP-CTERM/XrtA system glycosyltransferase [Kordiimonadaceae bacterium]|nr:TIGR03087 family PEP-CTERM/XrtA system glycosyltransferase [Kordiimonadaceae bacterium]MBO6570421.1 TIGR03087 family PEP-CTERM/XrtA system glycosyltransferase [Kordiimonadaceae bacterium]MBO6965481.1 TIGR03087 family PEP-CTERM/XrtA system glycosyltransferase [Kordiimonadaceae bacterium]
MAKILFVAHRIPYPPNKGDKIRSWNFLKHLCEHHEVHAGFFIDEPEDQEHLTFLETHCASVHSAFASPLTQKCASLRGFAVGRSLTEMAYPSKTLRSKLQEVLEQGVDLIFLFSAASRSFLPKQVSVPIITDFVDVDSAKWDAYAAQKSDIMGAVYAREGRMLRHFEQELAKESAASVFVSADEADLFKQRLGTVSEMLSVSGIANGVATEIFDPGNYANTISNGRRILFTGAMDYAPNVDAVEWFARNIFPIVRNSLQDAEFFVAGRPVAPAIRALSTIDGVTIVGGVQDMAAEIAKSDVVVAPLRTARGIQNKVLEGMAMAKPVVCTSAANEGINAPDGDAIVVADQADSFADAVVQLLNNPSTASGVGNNARLFVQQHNSWDAAFGQLDQVIERVFTRSRGQNSDAT